MALQVIKVDTNSRRDVNRFIELQFSLYRDCPQWVPPLIDDMKMQLNRRKYPYYEHSEADFFLAERDGRPVGRIAALNLSLIHISEPTRLGMISYAVFCLK